MAGPPLVLKRLLRIPGVPRFFGMSKVAGTSRSVAARRMSRRGSPRSHLAFRRTVAVPAARAARRFDLTPLPAGLPAPLEARRKLAKPGGRPSGARLEPE